MSTDLSLFSFLFFTQSVRTQVEGVVGVGGVEINGSVGLPQRLKKDKRFLGRKKIYDTSLKKIYMPDDCIKINGFVCFDRLIFEVHVLSPVTSIL